MRRSRSIFILVLTVIVPMTFDVSRAANAAVQERFAIEEYELFYEVLHPLQREALHQVDFQRIRSLASELVARGKAIVKLRVHENREFVEARRKFDRALNAFKSDAKKDSGPRLNKSFTAVYDSFEKLADLAPTVYWVHPPPTVALSCSSSNPEPGDQFTLTAYSTAPFDAEKQRFVWTLSGGKIVVGQGTSRLTIDTTGQAGQKISVTVEVDDGAGHIMATSCEVQVAANKQP